MPRRPILIATLAAALGMAAPGGAGTPEQDALLAARVYALGVEAEDWRKVASGAEIMLGVDPEAGAMMLERARALAAGDAEALAAIEDIAAAGGRGCIGGCWGAVSLRGKLAAGEADTYRIPYRNDRLAEVAVMAEDGAVLGLEIVDENGAAICDDSGTESYCAFQPKWDGDFHVTVRNSGEATASYFLITNH